VLSPAQISVVSRRRRLAPMVALGLAPLLFWSEPAEAARPREGLTSNYELRRYRNMASELYRATSADAETFRRALTNPAVREELERTLNKPLPDETLRAMIDHARAEANYRNGADRRCRTASG
jgi:hypothetical protein